MQEVREQSRQQLEHACELSSRSLIRLYQSWWCERTKIDPGTIGAEVRSKGLFASQPQGLERDPASAHIMQYRNAVGLRWQNRAGETRSARFGESNSSKPGRQANCDGGPSLNSLSSTRRVQPRSPIAFRIDDDVFRADGFVAGTDV